jgi:hypothetical protein
MHLRPESPDHVLMRFVERLPTTIRDVILARCCMAFGRLQRPNQDLVGTFRSILTAPSGEARAYMCAKMVAVVELALHADVDSRDPHDDESADAATPHPFWNAALKAPLIQKHWRAARNEFLSLRKDMLSVDSFQAMLLQPLSRQNDVR